MARSLRGEDHLCAQTQQQPQEALAQATTALARRSSSDRGDRLREAAQRLWACARATPRAEWLASTLGCESGAAQLLHLAKRAPWPASAGFRRLTGVVTLSHTKRLRRGRLAASGPSRTNSPIARYGVTPLPPIGVFVAS